MKDWRCKNHQFGGNRPFRKCQPQPSGSLLCYLDLIQVEVPPKPLEFAIVAERYGELRQWTSREEIESLIGPPMDKARRYGELVP